MHSQAISRRRLSVFGLSVCPCVCDDIVKVCEHILCPNRYKLGAVGNKDELIRLWGQKVKGQGHDETRYGQKALGKCWRSRVHSHKLFRWRHMPTGRRFAVKDHLVEFKLIFLVAKIQIRLHEVGQLGPLQTMWPCL